MAPSLPPATATPTQQLAELLIGEDLETWVRTKRADGRSWRKIARDLYEATDHRIDLTYEAIRRWFPDAADVPDTAA